MGILENDVKEKRKLTMEDIKNKELVIKMLTDEDTLINSETGQDIYRNMYNGRGTTLEPAFIIQRMILTKYNFTTDQESLNNYREIFRTYYHGPTNYDWSVLKCVTYMRENLCPYYTSKIIEIGDVIPNTSLFKLDGVTKINLDTDIFISKYQHTFLCAFSTS